MIRLGFGTGAGVLVDGIDPEAARTFGFACVQPAGPDCAAFPVLVAGDAAGCPATTVTGRASPLMLHCEQPGFRVTDRSGTVVHNPAAAAHYHLPPAGQPTVVRACYAGDGADGDDGARATLDLLQLARGLLLGQHLGDGDCALLHGGIIQLDGRGILLAGGKGAGKTSFALALLRAFGSRSAYICNDKALLATSGPLLAHGLPYAAAIGQGSLRQLPQLSPLARAERLLGDKHLLPQPAVQQALGLPARHSCTLTEVWICDIQLGQSLRREVASVADMQAAAAELGEFSHATTPRWLLAELGWPQQAGGALPEQRLFDELRWCRISGDPWSPELGELAGVPAAARSATADTAG